MSFKSSQKHALMITVIYCSWKSLMLASAAASSVLQYPGNTDRITGSYDKLQQLQKYKREALEVKTMVTVVLVTMEIKYTYCRAALLIHYVGMPCGLH